MSKKNLAKVNRSKPRKGNGNGKTPWAGGTIGPVSDLERHLPNDWWSTLFNSIYLKTDGDVVENDENTHREVEVLVRAAGLEPNDRILDLCCGQGRHCLELARRGFRHLTGVDRSRYLIRLARKRAKSAGLAISFHEGDARKFRLRAESFHCVALMGNSFGYFDREEDDLAVLAAVRRALRPGGILAIDLVDGDWMREHFVRRSWEWIDKDHFVCRERSLSSDGNRVISREVVVHAERGVLVDQFYAERLYSRGRIAELIERAGFVSVRDHGTLVAESTRDQDLGMMAHRMLLTAHSPQPVPARKSRTGPPFPKVTVVLGDPRLPDEVKPGGHFNEADLDTVARMRQALVRVIADSLNVPTPLETYLDPDDQSATLPSVFPALVKPNYGDSSIGITQDAVVATPEQLVFYLAKLRKMLPGRPVLIQEFLSGPEYTVGVIGNPGQGFQMLPVLGVDYTGLDPQLPQILGYESKWDPDSAYWTDVKYVEADLDEEVKRTLYDYSGLLFERLACRDYARFDFRADAEGNIKLLEVNPNPGWCWDGKFNLMASFADLRYAEVLRLILQAAQYRELNARTGQSADLQPALVGV